MAYSVCLERDWRAGREMKCVRGEWRTVKWREIDESRADGPDCDAGLSEPLYILYIPVVNKRLSVEVPYTGRFWLQNATKIRTITWQLKWAKQRQVKQQQTTSAVVDKNRCTITTLTKFDNISQKLLCLAVYWTGHTVCLKIHASYVGKLHIGSSCRE